MPGQINSKFYFINSNIITVTAEKAFANKKETVKETWIDKLKKSN